MKSLWNDWEAEHCLRDHASLHGEDLALRVYSSRLIGRDLDLVLHGGGNCSVKTRTKDLFGQEIEVLAVKGSGQDLARIEPQGFPLLELPPLRQLCSLSSLSDEEMLNQLRIRRLDASAPTPSVETLLHATLPHKFVDHSHADAVLILGNQPDGEALLREALGARVAILPWVMPGLPLAKAVAKAHESDPELEGIVLRHHGIVTFGATARQSYERMIELVGRAERFIQKRTDKPRAGSKAAVEAEVEVDAEIERQMAEVMPVVRGAMALVRGEGIYRRFLAGWRASAGLREFCSSPDCARLAGLGPLTPDHVIYTKGPYLVLDREQARSPEACRRAVAEYASAYRAYFEAHRLRLEKPPKMLDPQPRVVVMEGLGILAFGYDKVSAEIAADIAARSLLAKARAEALGKYLELPPGDLFEIEYWSLERAKLAALEQEQEQGHSPLAGQVALLTGAAGAIGQGIAEALLEAGAHVLLTDIQEGPLAKMCEELRLRFPNRVEGTRLDVTRPEDVDAAFAKACLAFGGVDIVIPNAGVAHVSRLEDMDSEAFRLVQEVNLFGTMNLLRVAARHFVLQGTGGSVIIQASKNVFAPGAAFGAYSSSKAAAHQLGKIAAMELAPHGVRVNMINADAVFGDEVPSGLWAEVGPERMRSRGLDEEGLRQYYRDRSLLKISVTPEHVGQAVVFLASGALATTGATLPIDGGVAAAFPR